MKWMIWTQFTDNCTFVKVFAGRFFRYAARWERSKGPSGDPSDKMGGLVSFSRGSVSLSMNPNVTIRNETDADAKAITDVTVEAFKSLEISPHTEQFIIEALRAAGALAVSLVAELDGRIVGQITFSPVTMSDGTQDWYGLGPVSVLPEYQRQGIGKSLIREGLSRLKSMHARGCCLIGHPEYYKKFGFDNTSELAHENIPPEVFLALSFDGRIPRGTVTFHKGFKADGQPGRAGDA